MWAEITTQFSDEFVIVCFFVLVWVQIPFCHQTLQQWQPCASYVQQLVASYKTKHEEQRINQSNTNTLNTWLCGLLTIFWSDEDTGCHTLKYAAITHIKKNCQHKCACAHTWQWTSLTCSSNFWSSVEHIINWRISLIDKKKKWRCMCYTETLGLCVSCNPLKRLILTWAIYKDAMFPVHAHSLTQITRKTIILHFHNKE